MPPSDTTHHLHSPVENTQLLALSSEQAAAGGPLVGSLVWMFAHESYPDYDGYTVGEGGG